MPGGSPENPKKWVSDKKKESDHVTCIHCDKATNTKVSRKLRPMAWFVGILLFICFFPLTCLPCCLDSFYCNSHTCEHCAKVVSKPHPAHVVKPGGSRKKFKKYNESEK